MPHAELIAFLAQAVVISFSGVMAPGPVTAVTLGMGSRNRHAGALVAIGHGIVEFPLMVLIIVGMGRLFQIAGVRIGIGGVGGAMLLLMGAGMLREIRRPSDAAAASARRGPVLTGVVLSIGNPYFLRWWATVGLTLASRAARLGLLAFALAVRPGLAGGAELVQLQGHAAVRRPQPQGRAGGLRGGAAVLRRAVPLSRRQRPARPGAGSEGMSSGDPPRPIASCAAAVASLLPVGGS